MKNHKRLVIAALACFCVLLFIGIAVLCNEKKESTDSAKRKNEVITEEKDASDAEVESEKESNQNGETQSTHSKNSQTSWESSTSDTSEEKTDSTSHMTLGDADQQGDSQDNQNENSGQEGTGTREAHPNTDPGWGPIH